MRDDEAFDPGTPPLPEYDDAYVLEHCYTPEGVDRSLILVALEISVEARLERLAHFTAGVIELRAAYDDAEVHVADSQRERD